MCPEANEFIYSCGALLFCKPENKELTGGKNILASTNRETVWTLDGLKTERWKVKA